MGSGVPLVTVQHTVYFSVSGDDHSTPAEGAVTGTLVVHLSIVSEL